MSSITSAGNRRVLILLLLVFFMVIALALRMVPALFIPGQGYLHTNGADAWYSMRQIEVMVTDFPRYNWFDPMTAYPTGKIVDWGPLYPGIAAVLCLALGASSRADIANIAGMVSPLMAVAMVPVTYHLGKLVWDRKAGIVAAGLVSVLSYGYFTQSVYGQIDHHIAEIFFTTLFFLAYCYALIRARTTPVDLNNTKNLTAPVLFSLIAGVLYFLGYITSPTVLLALLVVGCYTFIQYILDYASGQRSEYLLLVNGLSFTVITVLVTLFGFHQELSLTAYSAGHVLVMLGLLAETVLFYLLKRLFSRNRVHYILSILGIAAGGCLAIQFLPPFQAIGNQVIFVFGSSAYSLIVIETLPWTFSAAYETFNYALLLMAGGLVIVSWYTVRQRRNEQVFLLTWFAVILLMTILHQRFQLYLTVPWVILSAICITESVRWSWDAAGAPASSWFSRLSGQHKSDDGKTPAIKDRDAGKTTRESGTGILRLALFKGIIMAGILVLTIMVAVTSVGQDLAFVTNTPGTEISQDWIGTLDWLKTATPSPGVGYFQQYDQRTFAYPNGSYGIMAPWEEGHRITFFSERIPITNPFQDHLSGYDGAAAFFLAGNESTADTILTGFNGRYVITDLGTATDTFPSLVPWVSNSDDISPYIRWFFVRDAINPSELTKTHLLGDAYFQSMAVRLQMFDGSLVLPGTAQYTRYVIRKVPDSGETAGVHGLARVITEAQPVNVSQDTLTVRPEGETLTPGATYADLFSSVPYLPVKKVPALTHYRLIHESPTNISVMLNAGPGLPDIRSVKVFEYVKGACIPGEGVIELTVNTNTGRTFVYRQESVGGVFVVPYATTGSTSDVRAAGPYHIAGTTRTITVTEDDVLNGNLVTG
jgi:dolichyl-phosphooligosaccharide-protein glycotransferase